MSFLLIFFIEGGFTVLMIRYITMKNTIRYTISVLILLTLTPINAQVLFSDDFESYNLGALPNYSKGWSVTGNYNAIRIFSEPGRGKVLAWGWNTTPNGAYSIATCIQYGILKKYDTRDPGNDVLKLEYEFYSKNFTGDLAEMFESRIGFSSGDYYFKCEINANDSTIDSSITNSGNYKKAYNHTWIKVEAYFEYIEVTDTWNVYTYIPTLQYLDFQKRTSISNQDIYIGFAVYNAKQSYSGTLIKYDNIKLSAVPSLPVFANVNEWLSLKFNVYPNPADNIISITNTENVIVNQVRVYDIAGKQLSTQNFNREEQIQLNVENLSRGTYIMHLETNQGVAVKRFIKK